MMAVVSYGSTMPKWPNSSPGLQAGPISCRRFAPDRCIISSQLLADFIGFRYRLTFFKKSTTGYCLEWPSGLNYKVDIRAQWTESGIKYK